MVSDGHFSSIAKHGVDGMGARGELHSDLHALHDLAAGNSSRHVPLGDKQQTELSE